MAATKDIKEQFPHCLLEKVCSGFSLTDRVESVTSAKNLLLRPLRSNDFNKGYFDVISSGAKISNVEVGELFEEYFNEMCKTEGKYYVVVIEDLIASSIVASGTLSVEQKFIHGAAQRGRISKVHVKKEYENQQLGSLLVELLTLLSQYVNCYKTTLHCPVHLEGFFEKYRYTSDANQNIMYRSVADGCAVNTV